METILNIDNSILDFIQTYMRTDFLDKVFPYITKLGSGGFIWIVIALVLLFNKKFRKDGIVLSMSLIMCVIIGNMTLKPLIARIRPCDVNSAINLLIKRPTDFSFPSGHTLSSVASTVVIFHMNRKLGIGALILTVLIAFSRLYLYVHYPSDILGGIILGLFIGALAIRLGKIQLHKSTLIPRDK